jgi:hypothetical protein
MMMNSRVSPAHLSKVGHLRAQVDSHCLALGHKDALKAKQLLQRRALRACFFLLKKVKMKKGAKIKRVP